MAITPMYKSSGYNPDAGDWFWAEYYDGRTSRLVGREARRFQTWTIAGYIAAKTILAHPDSIAPLIFEEDPDVIGCAVRVGRNY